MQVAVAPQAAHLERREYSLAQRATLLCGRSFPGHLTAWREALQAQRRDGAVPATYVAAMCRVVAMDAATGALASDDALAAAVAVAELATSGALHAAHRLLQDLGALGNRHADLLGLALGVASRSRAALARAQLELPSLSGVGSVNERTTVTCLLGELYLARRESVADEAIA